MNPQPLGSQPIALPIKLYSPDMKRVVTPSIYNKLTNKIAHEHGSNNPQKKVITPKIVVLGGVVKVKKK